jgi:hypothetical protein
LDADMSGPKALSVEKARTVPDSPRHKRAFDYKALPGQLASPRSRAPINLWSGEAQSPPVYCATHNIAQ